MTTSREPRSSAPPSPYPWLSDEVWRLWNRDNPLGAGLDEGSPIVGPILTPVTDDDRRRAPVMAVPPEAAAPPAGSPADHQARLASTTGSGFIGSARWPVCDEWPAALLVVNGGGIDFRRFEAAAGPLDAALLEAYVTDSRDGREVVFREWSDTLARMRAGRHGGDGINVFHCRRCGRLYGTYGEP